MIKRHKWIATGLVLCLVLSLSIGMLTGCNANKAAAPAENKNEKWPSKPITLVVPVEPGGSVDMFARGLASYLPLHLGVPVIVENRPGGIYIAGTQSFLDGPDDGSYFLIQTQLQLSAGINLNGAKFKLDDFAFINYQQLDPATILVNKDSPYKTLDDLINDMKARPGEVPYAIMTGTGAQLSAVLFFDKLGLKPRIVNYRGGGEMRTALAGGEIMAGSGHAVGDYAFKDKIRCLATFTNDQFKLFPDSKPINEALKAYNVQLPEIGSLRQIMAKKSFKEKYPDRWETFLKAYQETLKDPVYLEYMKKTGEDQITAFRGPEVTTQINQEIDKMVLQYKDLLASQ